MIVTAAPVLFLTVTSCEELVDLICNEPKLKAVGVAVIVPVAVPDKLTVKVDNDVETVRSPVFAPVEVGRNCTYTLHEVPFASDPEQPLIETPNCPDTETELMVTAAPVVFITVATCDELMLPTCREPKLIVVGLTVSVPVPGSG